MFKATLMLGQKESPFLARGLYRHNTIPLLFNTSRRLNTFPQDHLAKHGPKIFKDHFGSDKISGLEQKAVAKDTLLVGELLHTYTTKDNPGVFLYRATEHNKLRTIEDATPVQKPDGPTIQIGLFKTKDQITCWQAHTSEYDTGIDTVKKILISPDYVKAAESSPSPKPSP